MKTIKQQSGVALAVSLVLLLVVTLIAVSALNISKGQRKIASNLQNANQVFRGAEQRVSQEMSSSGLITTTGKKNLPSKEMTKGVQTTGSVTFKSAGPVPEGIKSLLGSKNLGSSSKIQAFYYDVTVKAQHLGAGSSSELNIGYLVPAPTDAGQ